MTNLSTKCREGGWTLVMKLDRDKVNHFKVNNILVLYLSLIVLGLSEHAFKYDICICCSNVKK